MQIIWHKLGKDSQLGLFLELLQSRSNQEEEDGDGEVLVELEQLTVGRRAAWERAGTSNDNVPPRPPLLLLLHLLLLSSNNIYLVSYSLLYSILLSISCDCAMVHVAGSTIGEARNSEPSSIYKCKGATQEKMLNWTSSAFV